MNDEMNSMCKNTFGIWLNYHMVVSQLDPSRYLKPNVILMGI